MVDSAVIEEKMNVFRNARLKFDDLSPARKTSYEEIYRHILETEQISDEELIARAKKIKPLIRLRKVGNEWDIVVGKMEPDDLLVFTNPVDLRESYTYNFAPKNIVCDKDGSPLRVEGLREVDRFTCYHEYGDYYGCYRPSVDEVLSQIPQTVDLDEVSAFEIHIGSLNFWQVYDQVLDRHVSTVILYAMEGGLPEKMRAQEVILNEVMY